MRRAIGLAALLLASAALGALASWFAAGGSTTVTRLSPDETIRARVDETSPSRSVDRHLAVRLESLRDGKVATLLRSPDEGGPPGTERLVWSKDGAWLLLVGRHFYVQEDLFLDSGDQLYFLHHLPTGRSWLNSSEPEIFPPLKAEMVRPIEFTEPIRLRGD